LQNGLDEKKSYTKVFKNFIENELEGLNV